MQIFPGGSASNVGNPPLNALPQNSLGGSIQPGSIGGSFANGAAGITAVAIISPASNVHGAVVRTAIQEETTAIACLCTGTVAPTTTLTNPAIVVASNAPGVLAKEIYLPPGQGLWSISSTATTDYHVTYDLE